MEIRRAMQFECRLTTRSPMLLAAAASLALLRSTISHAGDEIFAKNSTKQISHSKELQIVEALTVATSEISGIATVNTPKALQVALIGDDSQELHFTNITSPTNSENLLFGDAIWNKYGTCGGKNIPKCNHLRKNMTTDWEALALDGSSNIFLLQEFSQTIFAIDRTGKKVISKITLDGQQQWQIDDTKSDMKDQEKSSYEGMVLLQKGHIIVAKEENPRLIIEFGPKGEKPIGISKATILNGNEFALASDNIQLVALAAWSWPAPGETCDTSDLAVNTSAELFALSETCRSVTKIELPIHGNAGNTNPLQILATWILPEKIKHPEGLTALSSDEWLVASDRGSSKKENLFRVSRK
jgi:hypothetical protein